MAVGLKPAVSLILINVLYTRDLQNAFGKTRCTKLDQINIYLLKKKTHKLEKIQP